MRSFFAILCSFFPLGQNLFKYPKNGFNVFFVLDEGQLRDLLGNYDLVVDNYSLGREFIPKSWIMTCP
jgi:hypothetical protein